MTHMHSLKFTQHQMRIAVQHYLTTIVLKDPMAEVTDVTFNSTAAANPGTFTIKLKPTEEKT